MEVTGGHTRTLAEVVPSLVRKLDSKSAYPGLEKPSHGPNNPALGCSLGFRRKKKSSRNLKLCARRAGARVVLRGLLKFVLLDRPAESMHGPLTFSFEQYPPSYERKALENFIAVFGLCSGSARPETAQSFRGTQAIDADRRVSSIA